MEKKMCISEIEGHYVLLTEREKGGRYYHREEVIILLDVLVLYS